MTRLTAYIDSQGYCRAQVPDELSTMGELLEVGIQSSIVLCDEVLSSLEDIFAGKGSEAEFSFNDYEVDISSSEVKISCYSHPPSIEPLILSLEDFRSMLQIWRECVHRRDLQRDDKN